MNVDNIPLEYHEIEDCLRAFLSIRPSFVTDQLAVVECVRAFRNARLAKGINCLPETLKLLDKALRKTPKCDSYVPYWELRGDVLDGLERREEARECYQKALEMKKAMIRQYHKSIEEGQQASLHKYGAFGKRIDRRRVVEKLGDMWADVARFLWKLGEPAQARRIMSDSTKVPHPQLYAFHKELGMSLTESGSGRRGRRKKDKREEINDELQQIIRFLQYNGPVFTRFRSENKSNLRKRL